MSLSASFKKFWDSSEYNDNGADKLHPVHAYKYLNISHIKLEELFRCYLADEHDRS
jgi:hypothetical protein